MQILLAFGWLGWGVISVQLIFHFIGFSGLSRMFPEGFRWWHIPVQLLTLVNFAMFVLFHPWR